MKLSMCPVKNGVDLEEVSIFKSEKMSIQTVWLIKIVIVALLNLIMDN